MRATILLLVCAAVASNVEAQQPQTQANRPAAQQQARRTIEDRTAGMRKLDGYFPLYWDSVEAKLYMEIPRLNTEVLHVAGLGAGLGSNDIGLDRGQLQGSRIVKFERVGPRVLMVQPNLDYRSSSSSPAEIKTIQDAFARSVLWGFNVAAQTGERVLVDMSDFLLRDATNMAPRLRPGSYRFEASRSSIYLPMTQNFPKNTEMEVELTFVQQPGQGGGGFGGGAFEGVGSVAATSEAASMRVHHSFVELPPAGFEKRKCDPRSGAFCFEYRDYSAPITQSQRVLSTQRHRLEKRDPSARVSDPVEPIVYYLDPGTPEPIRTALLEGGRWWNQAFEAAGYRNAFRVELLPEGASPLDIRYNVINWVHRSTRGWSYGASVTDPRTGEIIKGVVTLGSLRIRQDYMIAEGLLQPYREGTETPPELADWALARIRQLSAHEIGHTLGFGHNYYDSERGRISVMDYPHPLVTLKGDGTFDHSQVYENGIGEWDSVAVRWAYQDFPNGVNEDAELDRILNEAWDKDLRYMTNQDIALNPRVDQWSNGTNAATELDRMMEVRRVALSRFGENAIKRGMPMAQIEEVLVPLYLHHRYQVEAAGSAIGGQHYIYAFRGDGREPVRWASANEQRTALRSLLATIRPSVLALPQPLLAKIPPRPPEYRRSRELFPRWTGGAFDAITPAVTAAQHTLSNILDAQKAARLVQQNALDSSLPGLDAVIGEVIQGTFGAQTANAYEAEIKRAVERLVVEQLMNIAGSAQMPQVRAIASYRLESLADGFARSAAQVASNDSEVAHRTMLRRDIQRFLDRPAPVATDQPVPVAPPGAPIGEPAMDWLTRFEPWCNWW